MTTTTPAPIPAPTTNGRVIALAHYAGRALLEGVLARHGATFHQSVTIRTLVVAGESMDRDELVAEVDGYLKIGEPVVRGVVEELTAAKLLEGDPAQASRLRLTDAGRKLHDTTGAETAEISARLYAGIPAEDLAVAGRVLELITERANAELAGA
ncbi:MarR family transcriptional regulator [Streptomyces sp. NPDC047525]|uniref:MarR family transcriptional regulator n=1 Tax=Streptomyces sp. NPDC047525 TaxID=3155264 RepID=UPI0033D3FCE7